MLILALYFKKCGFFNPISRGVFLQLISHEEGHISMSKPPSNCKVILKFAERSIYAYPHTPPHRLPPPPLVGKVDSF